MPHLDVRYVTHDSGTLLHGLEKSFLQTEGPGGWTSYAFRDLYREIAAAGARVVMDGHGGDYTINPRGQRALARLLATGQWRQFITEFGPWRRHRRQTVLQTVKEDILYFLLLRPIVGPWRRFRRGLRPFGPTMPASRAFLLRMAAEGLAPDRAPGDARGAPMRAVSERVLRRQQNLATSTARSWLRRTGWSLRDRFTTSAWSSLVSRCRRISTSRMAGRAPSAAQHSAISIRPNSKVAA